MPSHYNTTSLTLLERVRQHQPDAWNRLVELYGPLVRYWCRRGGLGPEDTADVFQDVFRTVVQHVEGFQRDDVSGSFRGWLRVITLNKIRDHFRLLASKVAAKGGSEAQMRLHNLPDPLNESEDEQEQHLNHQLLHRALGWIQGDFEVRTWSAFWQSQIEEIPTDLIAQSLEMTPAAVRKAKYRVLRRLREEMEGLVDFKHNNSA